MSFEPLTIGTFIVIIGSLIVYRISGKADVVKRTIRLDYKKTVMPKHIRMIMAVTVSLAVLGCSLYMVVSNRYDADNQKFAYGFIGTIIGFWLRPEK